jgi:hypothetical protein
VRPGSTTAYSSASHIATFHLYYNSVSIKFENLLLCYPTVTVPGTALNDTEFSVRHSESVTAGGHQLSISRLEDSGTGKLLNEDESKNKNPGFIEWRVVIR